MLKNHKIPYIIFQVLLNLPLYEIKNQINNRRDDYDALSLI
jgi:hypothetical protein